MATECGIDDWPGFVAEIQQVRRQLGAPATRWAGPCLAAALQLATRGRGWPPEQAAQSLRRVAADPKTRSPMRVAEAGPWWDETPADRPPATARICGRWRPRSWSPTASGSSCSSRPVEHSKQAGLPITRDAVTRGAYQLLVQRGRHDTTGAA